MILRAKRGYRDFENSKSGLSVCCTDPYVLPIAAKVVKYDALCGFLFTGWGMHYFPFWIMGRQLFLHHYLPALYFGILLSCAVFDFITSTLRPRVRLQIAGVIAVIAIWNFQHYSPLAYGTPWTRGKCENARWLKTWDFSWCALSSSASEDLR